MAQEAVVRRAFENVTCKKCNQTFAVNKGTAKNFKCPCCSVKDAETGMTNAINAESDTGNATGSSATG